MGCFFRFFGFRSGFWSEFLCIFADIAFFANGKIIIRMKVYCKNLERYLAVAGGETLSEIYSGVSSEIGFTPVCALVNNKAEDLSFSVFGPKMVEFLGADSQTGQRVVVRTLCMMLYKCVTELFPGKRLRIEHSISHGYYCRLLHGDGSEAEVSAEDVRVLEEEMHRLAASDKPIVREERLTKDVIDIFREQGLDEKVLLLETVHDLYTVYYTLEGLADSYYGPLAIRTGLAGAFALTAYKRGFLLLSADPGSPTRAATPVAQEKMYKAFTDYLEFNEVIRLSTVGELNRAVRRKESAFLINVAEVMHTKILGRISDEIARRHREKGLKVVLIAGPSSSGKTTTTKRLAVQLMTNLLSPKMISLDDYFVDRDRTPRDSSGDYDYEHLEALDLERLNSDLCRLLAGEEINLPTYSFEYGKRIERERPMRLGEREILLIEGIHGLNPALTPSIPKDSVFKMYVSALSTLRIDDHNWISTTDTRLLRRIVRDNKYRHTSAFETLRRWPSVRRGEERWIFPYQENADATFNSSLIFELGVMKKYAEPLLHEVPHDTPQYADAYRLMRLLSYCDEIDASQIPSTSLLREFLGGSSFKY